MMEEKIQNSSLYGRLGKKERFFIMMRKPKGNPEYFVSPVYGYRLDDPEWPCFVCNTCSGWEICELKTGLRVSVYYYETRKEAVKDFPRLVALLKKYADSQSFIAGYQKNIERFEIAMNTYRKLEELSNGKTT